MVAACARNRASSSSRKRCPRPLALASLEPSLDAYRAGDVAIRRPAEDGDVVSPVDQFHGKGRSRTALGKQEDAASGAGDGDIEQASLLGIRVPFGHREDQIEQRVVSRRRESVMLYER